MKKILPLVLLAVITSSCQGLQIQQKPQVKIKDFDIESISLSDVTLLFDIEIRNPYPVGLQLDDIGFTFFIENKQLMKTSTGRGLKIRAKGRESSILRVNLKYVDIIKIIQDYTSREYLECLVDVLIVIPLPDIPGLQKSLPFNYRLKKKIPAIKPSISIARFNVQMPSKNEIISALKKSGRSLNDTARIYRMINAILSGQNPGSVVDLTTLDLPLKVNFDIEMRNNTKARLQFRKLEYDFLVNKGKLVDGVTRDIKNVGNTSILRISNVFSTRALSRPVLDAFRKQSGTYQLQGKASVKFPDTVKKTPLDLNFDETGRFNL